MSTLESKLAQLRALKAQTPATPSQAAKLSGQSNCLFLGTYEDATYTSHLKGMFSGYTTYVCTEPIELLSHLKIYCNKRGIKYIVSTNTKILAKLLELQGSYKVKPSLSNYEGSFFEWEGLEIVFISPLSQLFTVTYGKFLASRYISKLIDKSSWREATPFKWTILDHSNIESIYDEFYSAYAIAVDIETFKVNLAIRCIGYTAVFISNAGNITSHSIVLPMDSSWSLAWMRKFNNLPAQKIFQNGKYDCSYLLRYNAPVRNWIWDTAIGMHSWYSELPKDLAFLNAFFLRKVVYWKDLAETQDLFEYYKYNAMDTWATANVWITWMLNSPDWAKRNYSLEFPLVYPCLLAEMTGLKRDQTALIKARQEVDKEEAEKLSFIRKVLSSSGFNPGSPVQVKNLLKLLGCGDIESSNEKDIKKAMLRHPLNAKLLGESGILGIRGLRKLSSTYLRLDSDAEKGKDNGAKEFLSRILYALNPDGTDSGRLASREHHFWCGLQIQNVPRGKEVKQTICSEDGWYIAECDLEQAESRDTANISGDTALIAAVSGTRDFHSVNASAFFGRSYSDIYDDEVGKTKDKPLRDLAKKVNHGANYNMGPEVLIDTMGLDKIYEAGKLLTLNETDPRKIALELLSRFHKTYPKLRGGMNKPYYPGTYYAYVVECIERDRKLVSRAYHHTVYNCEHLDTRLYIESGDWTRYCFGNPSKNKLDLNSYVAHCPQSLNSRTLNEAFLKVFYEIALPNPTTFRLHAQIHDSILFSYKEGFESHADRVRECMEIPVTVRDVSGTYRTFTVPAALKLGIKDKLTGILKRAKYWSETE
jgi:DNA polymerase I-like protein with 3'-5' exonuclease and polymerase domains